MNPNMSYISNNKYSTNVNKKIKAENYEKYMKYNDLSGNRSKYNERTTDIDNDIKEKEAESFRIAYFMDLCKGYEDGSAPKFFSSFSSMDAYDA